MNSINILETASFKNGEEESQALHVCIKSYLNSALCHMKLGNYGKAVASCKKVLGWKREHPKALYICGKSFRHLGRFSESRYASMFH